MKYILFFATIASFAFANQKNDPWQGESYAQNSVSQKRSADDFLQNIEFHEMESILDVGF